MRLARQCVNRQSSFYSYRSVYSYRNVARVVVNSLPGERAQEPATLPSHAAATASTAGKIARPQSACEGQAKAARGKSQEV
jgi:hypothetical protein